MTLDVLMAGDTGLKCLVNQQVAVPPFPVAGSTGAKSPSGCLSPLRERMTGPRGKRRRGEHDNF